MSNVFEHFDDHCSLLKCLRKIGPCFLIWILALGDSWSTIAAQPPESTSTPVLNVEAMDEWQSSTDFGKTLLKIPPHGSMAPWTFSELPEVMVSSMDFLGWILRDEAHPHNNRLRPIRQKEGINLQVQVAAARDESQHDLVDYTWIHQGKTIRAVAGKNAVRFDFALQQIPQCSEEFGGLCVDGLKNWVSNVIKLQGEYSLLGKRVDFEVELPWPDGLVNGVEFSSAPEKNIVRLRGMPYWYDRVDAFLIDEVFSILIYKKVGQLMGYEDGSKWFPDDFRMEILQRSQGRKMGRE